MRGAQTLQRRRLPGRFLRAGLAAGLIALLLGSSASAAIPDATTNVMTGCYRTAGTMNLLYVLDTANQSTCPTGMSLTTWPGTNRRIVVVSPVLSGANEATDSGTALLNALAGITTASATNPWLIKIEPGVYDLNGGTLTMKPYVDIEGSGEGVTTITSSSGGGFAVVGADNAELRWVTVQNSGGSVAVGTSALAANAYPGPCPAHSLIGMGVLAEPWSILLPVAVIHTARPPVPAHPPLIYPSRRRQCPVMSCSCLRRTLVVGAGWLLVRYPHQAANEPQPRACAFTTAFSA